MTPAGEHVIDMPDDGADSGLQKKKVGVTFDLML
jgi:hypothetical protein